MSTVKHVNILFNLHMRWGGVDVNLVGALPSWRIVEEEEEWVFFFGRKKGCRLPRGFCMLYKVPPDWSTFLFRSLRNTFPFLHRRRCHVVCFSH